MRAAAPAAERYKLLPKEVLARRLAPRPTRSKNGRVHALTKLLPLLLALVASATPAWGANMRRHPGPPLWGEFRIEADSVIFHLEGERRELRALLGLPEARVGALAVELEPEFRAALRDHFHEILHIAIDGTEVRAELNELLIPDEDPDSWKPLTIQATLRYPCSGLPRSVALTMDQSENRNWFDGANLPLLLKHGKNAQMVFLSKLEPQFVWHRPVGGPATARVSRVVANSPRADATVPGISLAMLVAAAALLAIGLWKDLRPVPVLAGVVALAGGAWFTRDAAPIGLPQSLRPRVELPDVALATTIFESLHGNIYRAFDVSTEDDIYDLLAVSVEPTLLDTLYGDIYESLILREDGGAVCVIQDVQRDSVTVLPPTDDDRARTQFEVDCAWRVMGHVAHWGHIHRRVNEYRAVYTVRFSDRAWRIAAVEVKDHRRVDSNG